LRGDVIVVAVGLVIALAFSALITSFTANIINPIIQSFTGSKVGLGFQIRSGNPRTVVDFGAFISAIIYFVIFIAVVYFLIIVPYKAVQARRVATEVPIGAGPPRGHPGSRRQVGDFAICLLRLGKFTSPARRYDLQLLNTRAPAQFHRRMHRKMARLVTMPALSRVVDWLVPENLRNDDADVRRADAVLDVLHRLRDEGMTVAIIEHTMHAMMRVADRFVVLDHGAVLASGLPKTVVEDRSVIEAYLGKKWLARQDA
jgi:large conductance mechanosensitive channel protein